ncbi:MAG: MFS transporter [Planctomycetaceae bacterium]|nr:MFS transporter [Planctomycetaceae bacterium]
MTEQPTTIRYRTLSWLTVAAALAYLCRNSVGVAESSIREDLGLTLEQSGWFMGAFFWTYSLFQVPSGWAAERAGTRVALTLFALGWSAGCLGIGLAPGFWLLITAQLVMGVAQAGIFPASLNSIGHWMPLARRSLACGVLAGGMQVGAILAFLLAGPLIESFGWRSTFVTISLPSILFAIGFLIRFRNRPEQEARVNAPELRVIHSADASDESDGRTEPDELTELSVIFRSPEMWLLCGQQVCRAAGYMFFASWFPTFLQETRGVSIAESGYLSAIVLVGTLIGGLIGGQLTDLIWNRTGSLRISRSGVGAAALGGCALLILAAWFVESTFAAVTLLAIGGLLAAVAGPCAMAATIDIGGKRVPQVFGLMNMCGNLAAASCPILVGKLFDWTANWNLVLLVFAGVYFAGAVCWVFVNPRDRLTSQ